MQFNDYIKDHAKDLQLYKSQVSKTEGGARLEQYTHALLTMTDMTIKKTMPRIDLGFGADFLISYKEDNHNYSVYVDVTTYTAKANTKYLTLKGELVDNYKDAFIANFSFGDMSFGLKYSHANRFTYEKPVIVLTFQNVNLRNKGIDISDMEVRMIETFIKSLNMMLIDKGCNKRASTVVNVCI